MIPLSISIIVKNEAENIRECLQSVAWADEIVVVDSGSTDETVAICKEFTDRVITREWPGFAAQKQYAMDQCRNEWILSIDADERVRPDLQEEIQALMESGPQYSGYRIARRTYFLGKWIKNCGWYPGFQVRLFKKSKTYVSDKRVHEGFIVDGRVAELQHDLDHYSHDSLSDSLDKMNSYTTLEAMDRLDRKKVRPLDFFTHPFSEFWKKYIALKGFKDGMHGFLLSWISAFLKMVLYMKIWFLQNSMSLEKDQPGGLQ